MGKVQGNAKKLWSHALAKWGSDVGCSLHHYQDKRKEGMTSLMRSSLTEIIWVKDGMRTGKQGK